MFEFDKYDKRLHTASVAPPESQVTKGPAIRKISLLVWGEHCIECAAPDCYRTCDLYDRRSDSRCRRFVFGAFKNRQLSSPRGYGVEVSFKKWAKLEARGNTAMAPLPRVLKSEWLIERGAHVANVLGAILAKATGDLRWHHLSHSLMERLARRLHRWRGQKEYPDAFLVELHNPENHSISLQLAIHTADEQDDTSNHPPIAPFRRTLAFPPGRSSHEIETIHFRQILASGFPFDISLTPEGDSQPTIVVLMADFVKYAAKRTQSTREVSVKCVVFDLDNTLWDGILLENDEVDLRPGIRGLLSSLDKRGVLLSIASKNEHHHAWNRLESLGIADYFLYPQINWNTKSDSIKQIAKRLDIGIDTIAFVDDSPFERDQVAGTLPMVHCIGEDCIEEQMELPRFSGSTSADAGNRRSYYKDAIVREDNERRSGADHLEFLASCDIRLGVRKYDPVDFDRVSELVQRTNQLNFSGDKYTREALKSCIENERLEKFILDCRDKYGSYGTVGFAMVARSTEEILVRDFMLSCRVQGKFIEQAFFDYLLRADIGHPKFLKVNYRSTARNRPARIVLETLGFKHDGGEQGLTLNIETHPLSCRFIHVDSTT